MAVFFLVRPLKILAKRTIIDGNKVVAAHADFLTADAVAGTRLQFSLAKDSIVEFKVEGSGGSAAGTGVDLDLVIDGVFQATNQRIVAGVVTPATPAVGFPDHGMKTFSADANFAAAFNLSWLVDNLGEGVHSFVLYAKASTAAGQINAAKATNALVITVIEHADTYPPSASAP